MIRLALAGIAVILAAMKTAEAVLFAYWLLVAAYWTINYLDWRNTHD